MHRFLPRAILTLILLCAALPCLPKSYYVPGDASTIQGGIDLCADGDTVLVFPGIYSENMTLGDRLVSIISSDGPETTTIQPADPNISTFSAVGLKAARDAGDTAPGGEISGFTITGGGNAPTIDIFRPGRLIIKDNVIHDNIPEKITDKAVILCHGDSTDVVIARNIFYGNYGVTCVQVMAGTAAIVNNTFDGNRSAILSSGMTEAVNNIVVYSSGTALDGAFLRLDYNDVWNNIIDYG